MKNRFFVFFILNIVVALLFLLNATIAEDKNEVYNIEKYKTNISNDKKIYVFFRKGCPYCIQAINFIKEEYSDLNVEMLDVANKKNVELFLKFVEKYGLDKNNIGVPFICIGDKYILGWSEKSEYFFRNYIFDFKQITPTP